MNNKKLDNAAKGSSLDSLKWIVVVALLVAGIWANYYYSQIDWPIRLAGWIVLVCIVLGVALQTTVGRRILAFSKDARNELRKVIWPTRQETMQTTMLIVVMVIVMALILWGIDSALFAMVGWLTGQG